MMLKTLPRPRSIRKLLILVPAWTFLWIWILYITGFLPSDSVIILFARLVRQKAEKAFPDGEEFSWIGHPPIFDIDVTADVALIVKTAYSTKDRLPAFFDGWNLHVDDKHTVVIADFASASQPVIYDMVKPVIESDALKNFATNTKIKDYKNLTAAIQSGDEVYAQNVSAAVGWQLDSLKFISGLKFAFEQIPGRKWYMMVDDDTFIHKPSLKVLLGHLDPATPYYLGNQLGGWNQRFGHGGSSLILSRKAMSQLFDLNPRFVAESYKESLKEELGDRLLATTLMKAGVYLEAKYSDFFNGETPLRTKITEDSFCMPFLGFHRLKDREGMMSVSKKFRDINEVVYWHELWTIYGQPMFEEVRLFPIREDRDHVTHFDDEKKTLHGIKSAEGCRRACLNKPEACMAWVWEEEKRLCQIAPDYFMIGKREIGKRSGLNVPRVTNLMRNCKGTY